MPPTTTQDTERDYTIVGDILSFVSYLHVVGLDNGD